MKSPDVDVLERGPVDFTPTEVETIINYYHVVHPDTNARFLLEMKEKLEQVTVNGTPDVVHAKSSKGTTIATSLSGSAMLGLAGAITAPMIPTLAIAGAVVGLLAGWIATKAAESLRDSL